MKVRMYYLLSIEIFLNSCYTEIRRTIQSKVSFIIYISPSSRFDAVLSGELNLILWYESSVGTYSSKQRLNDYIAYWPPWRWEDGYFRGVLRAE